MCRETTLTAEDNDKLAQQSRTIKRTVLNLQYSIMSSNIKSGLKALRESIQELFVALAASCNQVYAGLSQILTGHHCLIVVMQIAYNHCKSEQGENRFLLSQNTLCAR